MGDCCVALSTCLTPNSLRKFVLNALVGFMDLTPHTVLPSSALIHQNVLINTAA